MSENNEPIKLIGFLCNWCSYAGADLAGVSRFQYDASIRIIRVPCSGRVNPLLALKAFQEGADGVLISGCHPGDCHYSDGNYYARRRFAVLRDLMDFLGIDPRRLQMSWVSASEGKKWADVVNEVAAEVRAAKIDGRSTPAPAARLTTDFQEVEPLAPTIDSEATKRLRAEAAKLLSTRAVKVVIGHGLRPAGHSGTTVVLAKQPEEVEHLIACTGCVPNLTQHLKAALGQYGSAALVGKGSDLYTALNLAREQQLSLEHVKLLGLACPGRKASAGEPTGRCIACRLGLSHSQALVLGEPPVAPTADDFADVALLDGLSRVARAAFWDEHFTNCIRCYACRNSCPSCYCATCFADSRRPTWVSPAPSAEANKYFHLVRAYHLAGRCGACGECSRVCPMGLPLLTLARKAAQVVKNRFGAVPSADLKERDPLMQFRPSDQVEFIR